MDFHGPLTKLNRDDIMTLIDRLGRARVSCDVEELRQLLDPNVSLRIIGDPALIYPMPTRRFGADAIIELILELKSVYHYRDSVLLKVAIDDDRVVSLRKSEVVHIGSGRIYTIHVTDWLRFRDRRIVEILQMDDGMAHLAMKGK